MRTIINLSIFILSLFLIVSCEKKEVPNEKNSLNGKEKDFSEIFNHVEDYKISVDIIKDDPLFKITKFLKKSEDEFIIGDLGSCNLLLVNKKGELLKRIGRKGQGPGEFEMLTDCIHTNNNKFYALDFANKVSEFDSELNFVKRYNLSFSSRWSIIILACSNGNFIIPGYKNLKENSTIKDYSFLEHNERTLLNLYNSEFKIQKSFLKLDKRLEDTKGVFITLNNGPLAPSCIVKNRIISLTQEGFYDIHIFDENGNQLKKHSIKDDNFVGIDTVTIRDLKVKNGKVNFSQEKMGKMGKMGKIISGHTVPVSIYNVNNYLLITMLEPYGNFYPNFRTKDDEMSYHIDIFKYDNDNIIPVTGNIKTTKKIIGVSETGDVYFVDYGFVEDIKDITIGKYKLNL